MSTTMMRAALDADGRIDRRARSDAVDLAAPSVRPSSHAPFIFEIAAHKYMMRELDEDEAQRPRCGPRRGRRAGGALPRHEAREHEDRAQTR